MKHLKLTILSIIAFLAFQSQAQTNWSNVDFGKEYKVKTKISGAVAKSLKNNPTFVNDYYIMQATHMQGSSHAGTLQKQGVTSLFAEAVLGGVSKEALQLLVDEIHKNLLSELQNVGLNITEGDELLKTKYVEGKKSGKAVMIGKTDGSYIYDKAVLGGGGIKERYYFRPEGKNIFVNPKAVGFNFYQKLATQQTVNLLSIGYEIGFANFEGSRKGLSKNALATTAGLTITPKIILINPKGAFSWITYEERVEGNNDWSKGLVETKSRDGSFWGLSSSADYALEADEAKYIGEVKNIVINLQKDIAKQIKETF